MLVRACAVGSAVAAICLVVLAMLERPGFDYSHLRILGGVQQLSADESEAYLRYLRANLSWDGVYLLGHVLTWIGYGVVVGRRIGWLGAAIGAVGIASGALDLVENEMRWAIVESPDAAVRSPFVALVWQVVVGMSFWAIYVNAVMVSAAILDRGVWGRAVAALGFLCVPAAFMLYGRGFFASFLWLIVWHAASALFLWREEKR